MGSLGTPSVATLTTITFTATITVLTTGSAILCWTLCWTLCWATMPC